MRLEVSFLLKRDTVVTRSLRDFYAPRIRALGHTVRFAHPTLVTSNPRLLITDSLEIRELENYRLIYPGIQIALADPKMGGSSAIRLVKLVDYCLVGSIELEARVEAAGGFPILQYWIPDIDLPGLPEREKSSSETVLFYHGNRRHFSGFVSRILPHLNQVGREHPIAVEAHLPTRRAEVLTLIGAPSIQIRKFPWSEPRVWERLRQADIGLVPNLLPNIVRREFWPSPSSIVHKLGNPMGYRNDDYRLRFKAHSNPGRIFPFAQFAKPVVADFFPSSAALVSDGVQGYLPLTPEQWGKRIRSLVENPVARVEMGTELYLRARAIIERDVETQSLITLALLKANEPQPLTS